MKIQRSIPLALLVILISTYNLHSQNYNKLEWDIIGISYLVPTSNDVGPAIGFSTEARININNKMSIGLNYRWQFFDELFGEPIRSAGITKSFGIASNYYLLNNINNRAFAGFAIGIFNNSGITESGLDVGGTGVGFTPAIGYEINALRLSANYNYTTKTDFPNFFEIGLALNIGGRYKE